MRFDFDAFLMQGVIMREGYRVSGALMGEILAALPDGELKKRLEREIRQEAVNLKDGPLEERCKIVAELVAKKFSIREIAVRAGVTEQVVYLLHDVYRLDESTRKAVYSGEVTPNTGRVLSRIKDPQKRQEVMEEVLKRGLREKVARKFIQDYFVTPQQPGKVGKVWNELPAAPRGVSVRV